MKLDRSVERAGCEENGDGEVGSITDIGFTEEHGKKPKRCYIIIFIIKNLWERANNQMVHSHMMGISFLGTY